MSRTPTLNERAAELCRTELARSAELRLELHAEPGQPLVVDAGIKARGGLAAGLLLARAAMAGLGEVRVVPWHASGWGGPAIAVYTDHPLLACMCAQYAGWRIAHGKYFAMGSGPMRALAAQEALFGRLGYTETSQVAVGVLETPELPPAEVAGQIAAACRVEPHRLTLLAGRTASQAGTVQVAARAVETAMHKLFELGFDLSRVESGFGVAPLPPVARDDLTAIGRTNDAVLYGGEVTLWLRAEDDELASLAARLPSSASPAHGRPFLELFAEAGHDFYRMDPHLFSPAVVRLCNLQTGRSMRCGELRLDILERSFQA
jgi:methenyltetrahydromethanopterin cyclohydrolase